MSLPTLLDVSAVARLTGRTESTVRAWARGERPGIAGASPVRVGGQWMWRGADLERVLDIVVEDSAELRRLLDVLDGERAPRTWNGRSLVS